MTQTQKTYFSKSHAFIIGINDYTHVSPLRTAVNDARRLSEELESKHQYQSHLLLNPKQQELKDFLRKKLIEEVQKDDRVIFYFAGHGIAIDAPEGVNDKPEGYLVPLDAQPDDEQTFVSMDLLNQQLKKLPSRHVLLILDCCFAGSFEWSSQRTRFLGSQLPKKIYQERFDRYIKDPAWQVITSSAHDQKALDVLTKRAVGERGESQSEHSPFALSLFEALDGKADVVPADEIDGVITASELYIYLRDQVERQSISEAEKLRQTPKFFNLEKHDKGEFIFFHPRHKLNLSPIPQRNPYKGLQSFEEEDQNLFYGRDRVIKALQEKVAQHNFLVISGASGTGKSSVIKAGLMPKMRGKGFLILPKIRPNKHPIRSLEVAFKQAKFLAPDEALDKHSFTKVIQKISGQKVFILIDQYEELITQCKDEEERKDFVDFLVQLLEQNPSSQNLQIVITVRSDFEPQLENQGLEKYWNKARFTVPPFNLEELMEVIEKPAIQEVLSFDPPELVNEIANEVIQAPGALPLLSFLLSELYQKCYAQGRNLSKKAYQELGGVVGSLRTSADSLYSSLEDASRKSMRNIMLRMVSLEGGELASRRVFLEELVYEDASENTRVQAVLDQLLEARLIVRGQDNRKEVYVEPAHDALVRAWASLWEWIKQFGEENILLQRRLFEATQDVEKVQADLLENPSALKLKDQSALLWEEDPRIEGLYNTSEGKNNWLNHKEVGFVRASRALKERLKKKRRRELIGAFSSLGLLLLAAIGFAIYAFYKQAEALEGQRKAEQKIFINDMSILSQEIPSDYPILKGRMLLQAEMGLEGGYESEFIAYDWGSFQFQNSIPNSLVFDGYQTIFWEDLNQKPLPDGYQEKQVWGEDTKSESLQRINLSPSRDYIAAFTGNAKSDYLNTQSLDIWDLTTGNLIYTFNTDQMSELKKGEELMDAAFTPDEKELIIVTQEGQVLFYDFEAVLNDEPNISASKKLVGPALGPTSNIELSPEGRYLFQGGSKEAVLWDLEKAEKIKSFDLRIESDLEISHRGSFSENGKRLVLIKQFDSDYNASPYSPNAFAQVQIWDLPSLTLLNNLTAGRNFQALAISPDGEYFITSVDQEVLDTDLPDVLGYYIQVYKVAGSNQAILEKISYQSISKLAFTPDNRHFLAQTSIGMQYHDLESTESISTIAGFISSDGKAMLVQERDGAIHYLLAEDSAEKKYLGYYFKDE